MKREKIVHIAITEDEMAGILGKISEKENEDGKRYTVSTFLREYVLRPYLNGIYEPPQVTPQETVQDTPPLKDPYDEINF